MNILNKFQLVALGILATFGTILCTSCSDSKSYAEYLEDERKAVNAYLCDYRVVNSVPADTVFECGKDAPFYRLQPDGEVFMQVINPGDRKNNKAQLDQQIYFRFMRTNLLYLWRGYDTAPAGNANDMSYLPTSFRYGNYSLQTSSQYGQGIQMPLDYLGIDCEVNLIVRSQYGITNEIGEVTPYLYNIRYFTSKL